MGQTRPGGRAGAGFPGREREPGWPRPRCLGAGTPPQAEASTASPPPVGNLSVPVPALPGGPLWTPCAGRGRLSEGFWAARPSRVLLTPEPPPPRRGRLDGPAAWKAPVRARVRTGAGQALPSGALAAWVPGMLICDLRLKSHCQGLPRNHDLGCSSGDPQWRSPSAVRASPSSRETTEADGPRKLPAGPLIRPSDDLSAEVQSLADW